MKTQIDIRCSQNTDEKIAEQIRLWAEDIIANLAERAPPDRLKILIYHRLDELQNFFRKEKEALGIFSEGEAEFIAIHEAWRGYPRIHICSERIKNLPETVVLGAVQHELAHAILHGRPEFYTFRFSRQLVSAGEALGLDIQLLQQFVYLLSIALKDGEAVIISDVKADSDVGFSDTLKLMNIGSVMCIPLINRLKIRGILYLDTIDKTKGFRTDDLALLKAISSTIALTIDNFSLL